MLQYNFHDAQSLFMMHEANKICQKNFSMLCNSPVHANVAFLMNLQLVLYYLLKDIQIMLNLTC